MSEQSKERIGFLGLGIMGSRMAINVRRAGFPLTVWTHTPGQGGALGRLSTTRRRSRRRPKSRR